MLKDKLIAVCNQELSDDELRNAIEVVIAESRPFDHSSDITITACDINEELLKQDVNRDDIDTISKQVEQVEKTLPKREIAFLFANQNNIIQEVASTPIGQMLLKKIMGDDKRKSDLD